MLTVNQLTLTHRKDLTVLVDSLSFTLNDGERLALIGEEGNGKSTLLRVLAGDPSVLKAISRFPAHSPVGTARRICRRSFPNPSGRSVPTISSACRPSFSINLHANWANSPPV